MAPAFEQNLIQNIRRGIQQITVNQFHDGGLQPQGSHPIFFYLGALLSYHYVIKLENTINLVESTPIHIFGATVSIASNRLLPLLVVVP